MTVKIWNRISGPRVDVTGDDFGDTRDRYCLMLVERIHGKSEYDRDSLVYMNFDQTIKMIADPFWNSATGNTYTLTVFKAENNG